MGCHTRSYKLFENTPLTLQRNSKTMIIAMQKNRYISLPETNPANPKVNRANVQSALWRIRCASAHGKLCLGATEMLSSHQNYLPPLLDARGKNTAEVGVFLEAIRFDRLAAIIHH
jgi:hypothetical protein